MQVTPLPPVLLKQFLKMYLHTSNTHNLCRLYFHEQLLSEPPAAAPTPHSLPPPGSCTRKAQLLSQHCRWAWGSFRQAHSFPEGSPPNECIPPR